MSEIATICASCNKATQEIFEDYACTKCRIEYLEESLKVANENLQKESVQVNEYEKAVSLLAKQLEEESNYKIAYQTLLYELGLKKSI